MTTPVTPITDAHRMALRSYVQLASEAIASFWPMRTFIHHNPLHGLEGLPFEKAVARGTQLFGGRGYLPNSIWRQYVQDGRIHLQDLHTAVSPLATDSHPVVFAGRPLTHREALSLAMIHDLTGPESRDTGLLPTDQTAPWLALTDWVRSILPVTPYAPFETPAAAEEAEGETLSVWCDRTLGTSLAEAINREMVKWCSAFLDEGEAGWAMPYRDRTFYRGWKSLAEYDRTFQLYGIPQATEKIRALPDRPEDALLEHLAALHIPETSWEHYLASHLAALPGWTGYIKWRALQTGFPWQERYPIDLVKYLAVRLFYERELVARVCHEHLALPGHLEAIRLYRDHQPLAYQARQAWVEGQLPAPLAEEAARLAKSGPLGQTSAWNEWGRRYRDWRKTHEAEQSIHWAARTLWTLAQALLLEPEAIASTPPSDARTLLDWLRAYPSHQHGPYWLNAYEVGFRRRVLTDLTAKAHTQKDLSTALEPETPSRPLAQLVFCIDVRSEVFRRHLEQRGGYETWGLAGFFGVPLDFQPFGTGHSTAHCPVLLKPKNQIREVPRSYHSALADRHRAAAQLSHAVHTLLHDLKGNVVTPYVMVEALGWAFSLPLIGKTLFSRWYRRTARWIRERLLPPVATTLTVEKLTRAEAEAMIATEHYARIRELMRERFGLSGAVLSTTVLDKIRRKALGTPDSLTDDTGRVLGLTREQEEALYRTLREQSRISPRGIEERLDRLTYTGFSPAEQAYFVEAALRLMGLTSTFSRLVVFCAHGSTTENNPYESALDCGACGGNQGLPNARAIASMANHPTVRALLKTRGIVIPSDTHFVAAQHDTTTDHVQIADLEDIPATHRRDLQRLITDLADAAAQATQERHGQLLPATDPVDMKQAVRAAHQRSLDWGEVRQEWGLSRNGLMIIGRRALTQSVNLHGRAFLHSYDYRQDASGKLLETIMTAPLVVAQWINMEHYFSTVDNEVYGSGSKVYHNVVGRIGVMTGAGSDLRIGLPAQTVLRGRVPYHEPMRLLAVIDAPRDRVLTIIARHPLLEQLFHQRWVSLVVREPENGLYYYYDPATGWKEGVPHHDESDTASDEGNQDRHPGRPCEICH